MTAHSKCSKCSKSKSETTRDPRLPPLGSRASHDLLPDVRKRKARIAGHRNGTAQRQKSHTHPLTSRTNSRTGSPRAGRRNGTGQNTPTPDARTGTNSRTKERQRHTPSRGKTEGRRGEREFATKRPKRVSLPVHARRPRCTLLPKPPTCKPTVREG